MVTTIGSLKPVLESKQISEGTIRIDKTDDGSPILYYAAGWKVNYFYHNTTKVGTFIAAKVTAPSGTEFKLSEFFEAEDQGNGRR